MFSALRKTYNWMGTRIYSRYADVTLAVCFFIEAIFFIPTDPMLIIYCLERRSRAFYYATIATLSSVLGGLTGYFIGYFLWHSAGQQIIHSSFVNYLMTPATFYKLCGLYKQYQGWAILLAAFTPIPYKAATLTAGFCNLNLIPFIIASLIGRGARFYLYAIIISIWGHKIKYFIERYFNALVVLIMVLIGAAIWLIRH